MTKWWRRIFNPLMAFIGIQLAWILVVVVWLYWFLGSHRKLRALAEQYSPELLRGGPDWIILAEGLLLLVAILAGVYVIFLYWTRQSALVREQKLFISQVTHELKSPLASLQLHLETIRRRPPTPERLAVFMETMLGDAARLNGLIDNMLSASRIDQRKWRPHLQCTDLSEFLEKYLRSRQFNLPRAGTLTFDIEPNLQVEIDREAMETVFRNLLENAVLYSDSSPSIHVEVKAKGPTCYIAFSDQGRGIPLHHQKKVFNLFYRIRRSNENIRGSGLGLYIVQATIRQHRGKISIESRGPGQGTTFHIELPLAKTPPGAKT